MTRRSDRCYSSSSVVPVILLLSMVIAGCSNRPDNILTEKEMVALMADMQLAEAYTNVSNQQMQVSDYRLKMGKSVLAAHGITQEQLDTTLAWYGRNLDDYSELYAKVDKEIIKRRKHLLNMSGEEDGLDDDNLLWRFGKNGQLSMLGNTDGWIVSVTDPDLQKGDRLQWTMHLDAPVQMNGVLGVEYSDGSSEAGSSVFIGRNRVELVCQTDTGKDVKRIYGTLRIKNPEMLPVYADSIRLVRLPYDSVEYRLHRSNKHYGIPSVRKPKKEEAITDTLTVAEPVVEQKAPEKGNTVMWNADRRKISNSDLDESKVSRPSVTPHKIDERVRIKPSKLHKDRK